MKEGIRRALRKACYMFCRYVIWRGKHRPQRMFRYDRPIVEEFSLTERLYFRIHKTSIDVDTQKILPTGIRFPDQSVNRQNFSIPSDVLIPEENDKDLSFLFFGVAKVEVQNLPTGNQTVGNKPTDITLYKYCVEHDPVEDNYSHSELRVYKRTGTQTDWDRAKKVTSPILKKAYKTDLAFKSSLQIKAINIIEEV